MRTLHTVAGRQTLLTVYESGLYRLIFQSRKPEAKLFQKWVFGEVLPGIRKHGIYPPPEDYSYQITLKPYTSRVVRKKRRCQEPFLRITAENGS